MTRRPPYFTPTGPPRWWYTIALGLWFGCFLFMALAWSAGDRDGLRAQDMDRAPAEEPHTVELTVDEADSRVLYLEFPRTEEGHPWHLTPSSERSIAIWVEPEPDGDAVRFVNGLADYTAEVDGTAVWGFGMAEIDLEPGEHVLYVESELSLDDARLAVGEPVRETTATPALIVFALALCSGVVALVTALGRRRAAKRITTTAQGA
ncbi:hypothetical protein [Nocardiopsis lambiniae]|uniref:Uncharacterized protein n=1 Tax=Nocardiopsis lambiniae TaxID=3075539 RepID=A0ABU2M5Y0_9ACTN|nr:hypothetical protein [Nocardiopsis sp. DSM 44743]MDT0328073.1 hypothetical protein [Nocardiopsis sp. DSM 44743]